MAYEVMTAFFLEAGFLGIMLFGMERVGKGFHFFATVLVALGTLFSAFWILAANSWMHTPQGYAINGGQFVPEDWFAIVFNPSFPYRFVHMVLAAYLTTAFVVGAVGAYHLLRDSRDESARIMFSMALWMALAVAPLQAVAGDLHGLNTFAHQPAKIAAIEGHWETQRGAPLILVGMPDMAAERTHTLLEVPRLGSLILVHDWDGEVPGLASWPPEDRPYAPLVFWSFRVMVGIGVLMIATALAGLALRLRGRLATARWFQRWTIVMAPTGFIAVIAGWVTTEVGRQPFLVYGAMRTAEGRSPIAAPAVAGSLIAFLLVYVILFGAGLYYIIRLMRQGPGTGASAEHRPRDATVPAAPVARTPG
jgi:cytochrome d ubiquinol oxidase subunit I